MTKSMSGQSVIARTKDAIYVRIPPEFATPINRCGCDFCKSHPHLTPMWDTLCVPFHAQRGQNDYVSAVHMPDPEKFRQAMAAKQKNHTI